MRVAVFGGIADQIAEHLIEPHRVHVHRGRLVIFGNGHATPGREVRETLHRLTYDHPRIHPRLLEGEPMRLEARHVEQVADHT